MWIIKNVKTGETCILTPDQEKHTVGRSNGDLVIRGDSSISRLHATFVIHEKGVQLVDAGSKYGTYKNDGIESKSKVTAHSPLQLNDGDRIMFGQLGSEWRVENMRFITLVSTLTADQKTDLKRTLGHLGGEIVEELTENCTHLTMDLITVTLKVLQALVLGIPIVTTKYWEALYKSIVAEKKLVNCQTFSPPLMESFLRATEKDFMVNKNRRTLFEGKTFYFMIQRHMERYKLIIEMAGGVCNHLGNKVQWNEMRKHHSIVVQFIPSQATQSQMSQGQSQCEKLYDKLRGIGKRPIPDCEIGMAIISCSVEKYCNPDKKMMTAENVEEANLKIQTSKILAADTPMEVTVKKDVQLVEQMIVPDSDLVNSAHMDQADTPVMLQSAINTEPLDIHHEEAPEPPQKRPRLRVKSPEIEEVPSQENSEIQCQPLQKFLRKSTSKPTAKSGLNQSFVISQAKTQKTARPPETEPPPENTRPTRKRNLNVTIEDDDNPFAFKDIPKKRSKVAPSNSGENVPRSFNFVKPVAAISLPTQASSRQSQVTSHAEPQPSTSSQYLREIEDDRPASPLKETEWLSRFNRVTTIKDEDIKTDNTEDDMKPNETKLWIDSIKNCFNVKAIPVKMSESVLNNNRSIRHNGGSTSEYAHKSAANSTIASNGTVLKNFKRFVKQNNYKPQTTLISTKPIVIDHD